MEIVTDARAAFARGWHGPKEGALAMLRSRPRFFNRALCRAGSFGDGGAVFTPFPAGLGLPAAAWPAEAEASGPRDQGLREGALRQAAHWPAGGIDGPGAAGPGAGSTREGSEPPP